MPEIKFYGGPYHGMTKTLGPYPPKKLPILFVDQYNPVNNDPPSPIGPTPRISDYDLMLIGATVNTTGVEYQYVYVFSGIRKWM